MQRNSTAKLAKVIAAVQRRWGTRALRVFSAASEQPVSVVSTGFEDLDRALAVGGVPRGRVTELLGTPTSGMTTIALTLIARAQAQGDLAAYIDLSKTFDTEYAAHVGVDLAALLLVRPTSAADALEMIQALVGSGGVGVLVVDALALLQTVLPVCCFQTCRSQ